jgi:iron complex transport system substrate-binding protein
MWSETTAVKDGEVYAISFDATAGLRKKFGPLFIAKALYPETFSDLDPESFLMTYLEDYLGLEPQGFYIYPPL